MEKSQKEFSPSSSHKITQIEERLQRMWDCLLHMSDKITEIKYLIKTSKSN